MKKTCRVSFIPPILHQLGLPKTSVESPWKIFTLSVTPSYYFPHPFLSPLSLSLFPLSRALPLTIIPAALFCDDECCLRPSVRCDEAMFGPRGDCFWMKHTPDTGSIGSSRSSIGSALGCRPPGRAIDPVSAVCFIKKIASLTQVAPGLNIASSVQNRA
jgi:hypothetical protein